MRALCFFVVLLFPFAATFAGDEGAVRVELQRAGAQELTSDAKQKMVAWTQELLKSANFNTVNQADELKQSVTDIADHYRETVHGDYLVVSYPHPRTFKTIGGDVTAVEIVVGLSRAAPYAIGLFTIDPQGKVVLYAKYAASVPPEVAPKHESTPDATPR